MESAWRGLEELVNNTNFQADITIDILDVAKDELAEDFPKNSSSLFSSALFDKVYIKEYDQFGGRPYGVMLGLYDFTASRADLTWLERMGTVANAAHCPFISAASPKFFDCDSVEQLESLKNLDGVLSHPRYSKWHELRGQGRGRLHRPDAAALRGAPAVGSGEQSLRGAQLQGERPG